MSLDSVRKQEIINSFRLHEHDAVHRRYKYSFNRKN